MTKIVPGLRQVGVAPAGRRFSAGTGHRPLVGSGSVAVAPSTSSPVDVAGVIAFPIAAESSPFTMPVLEQTAVGTYLSLYFSDQWGWGMQVTAIADTKGNSYEFDAGSSWYGTQVWRARMASPVGPGDQLQVTYVSQFGEPNWGTGYVAGTTFKQTVNLFGYDINDGFHSIPDATVTTAPGEVVIGYGGFYHASSIASPTGGTFVTRNPWIDFLEDMSVPDSQVVGSAYFATETVDVFYDPAAPDGGWDEGIVLLYTH